MKTTPNNMISTLRKLREGATIIISWENWPKKEGAYLKMEIDTDRLKWIADTLQKSDMDYKASCVRFFHYRS